MSNVENRHARDAIIVIFGAAVRADGTPSATLRARVIAAASFAHRFRAPLFIPTGGVGRFGAAEAMVMRDLLLATGVSDEQIVPEPTGTDTLSSVRAVRRILLRLGATVPIHAASSAYHLPRCVLLLRLAGLPARACPPPDRPAATRPLRRWFWRLREIPALPYDAALVVGLRLLRRL